MSLLMSLVRIYAVVLIVWAMLLVGLGGMIGAVELALMVVLGLGVAVVLSRRAVLRFRDAEVSSAA